MWYTFRIFTSIEKIKRGYVTRGYTVESVLIFLKRFFEYDNGAKIKEDLGVTDGFINSKLVYEESELFDLIQKMTDLIDYLKETKDERLWWQRSRLELFSAEVYPSLRYRKGYENYLVGKYEIRFRFTQDMRKMMKSLLLEDDIDENA